MYFLQQAATVQEVPCTVPIITPDAASWIVTIAGTDGRVGGGDVFQRWGESIVPRFLEWHNRGSRDPDGTAGPGKQHPSRNGEQVQRFPAG